MTATFHVGDAIQVMNRLPEKSVDLILSSPPFLALRSYLPADHPDKALEGGSQATPGAYIDWLVDVVEACARILAPHGSLCFELGDTYAGSGGGGGDYLEGGWREGQAQFAGSAASMKESNAAHWRQKNSSASAWPLAKSLSLIPELFRYTLVYGTNPLTGRQTERWRLRNVIRWVRPNPPVGALGDKFRPATSELMVFCKSSRRFFDLDAVRGEVSEWTKRYADRFPVSERATSDPIERMGINPTAADGISQQGAPPLDWWKIPSQECGRCGGTRQVPCTPRPGRYDHTEPHLLKDCSNPQPCPNCQDAGSPLDWWNIPPGGYQGAHYAVWPPELLIRPIKAMCPEQVCRTCGEPRRRIVDAHRIAPADDSTRLKAVAASNPRTGFTDVPEIGWEYERTTLGFSDCGHNNWRPGLILDPFVGSGTTLAVATGHGRDAIGIDLDERNYALALERVGPLILQRGEVAA